MCLGWLESKSMSALFEICKLLWIIYVVGSSHEIMLENFPKSHDTLGCKKRTRGACSNVGKERKANIEVMNNWMNDHGWHLKRTFETETFTYKIRAASRWRMFSSRLSTSRIIERSWSVRLSMTWLVDNAKSGPSALRVSSLLMLLLL